MAFRNVLCIGNGSYGIYIRGDQTAINQSAGSLLDSCKLVGNGAINGGHNLCIDFNEFFTVQGCMIDVPAEGSNENVLLLGCERGNITHTWIGGSKGMSLSLAACREIAIMG